MSKGWSLNSGTSLDVDDLLQIMARLRSPENGCPWDVEQTFDSIAPYTLEEAYEVADAIDRKDYAELKSELGDLLFQVVFHARMAEETSLFDFGDVVAGICEKMMRRHPHVFADAEVADAEEQSRAWETHKAREREAASESALAGVAGALPALVRAQKLQRRAARVGFDWPDIAGPFDKCREELDEIAAALDGGSDEDRMHEIGDLLFSCVNLARHAGTDAEAALRRANARFEARFRAVEARLADRGKRPQDADPRLMDALWETVKREGS